MKSFYALLIATLVSQIAYTSELDLTCVTEDVNATKFEVRQVIIGDETEFTTLQVSSKNKMKIELKQYAVVIEIVGGDNGAAATEKWKVLNSSQFLLEPLTGIPEEAPAWRFSILGKKQKSYVCGESSIAYANPAFTKSN